MMNPLDASFSPASLGKVAVLMGGVSAERPISLLSGTAVLDALRSRGVDAHGFDPREESLWTLKTRGFDRCFIALHGRLGEDGCVQGALEYLGIPYTGSGVLASSLAMDKVMTKRVWQSAGIPTPAWALAQNAQEVEAMAHKLGLPLVVKPAQEGSSIGITIVQSLGECALAYEAATACGSGSVLCEQFIQGPELTCAVLGSTDQAQALPLIRIEAPQGRYDYTNKYFTDEVKYHLPCGFPADQEAAIQALAVQAYQVLGCRTWARLDVMWDAASARPFFLEINTAPGMTSHSLVPMAARAIGLSYADLCVQLLLAASQDSPINAAKPELKASA
jgi:D-alanine-D-alanine ligase